ncbi:phosphotransferase [Streptomyces sp. NPDC059740]|uniref:phosphotransferase n=1 Tax=Streptomyces sp. NPDC059740 TaxID=3346926 RepID=UPI003667DA22
MTHAPSPPPAPERAPLLDALLRHHPRLGEPLTCTSIAEGLLNRGWCLTTTRGRYFLKHHLDGDGPTLHRQHRATHRLHLLGLPVAPPLTSADGRTVTVVAGACYALHPWVAGRHLAGADLSPAQCHRLGALLGRVHTALDEAMACEPGEATATAVATAPPPCADPRHTRREIDALLHLVRRARPRDGFDELAEHRLTERRTLLEAHRHRRPGPPAAPVTSWVHGDFHPLNLLYRKGEPAAIVDWDRLGVAPRAEEAVRAAAIFFVRPCGTLDLPRVRRYATAYRDAAGADPDEVAEAVHRVWWERLNDFWTLQWRYRHGDRRADPLFPAVAALAVWWTGHYEAVREAFCG